MFGDAEATKLYLGDCKEYNQNLQLSTVVC
jgi:hypothetical protein